MKLLILDHLKRWWYLWLLIGGVEFLVFGISSNLETPRTSFASFPTIFTFQLIYFAGVFPLSYDLQRGHGRALMALPVSAKQIGRAWWMVSVGLPAVLLAVISGLGMSVFFGGATKGVDGNSYLGDCITITLWFGTAFFLLINLPVRQPQSPAEYARIILFFVVLVFGFSGLARFGVISSSTTGGMICMLIAAVLTIAGWFRAEHLVMQRAGARAVSQRPRTGQPQYKAQTGFGGLPFLFRNLITRFGYFGLLYLGLTILLMMMMKTTTGDRLSLSLQQLVEAIKIPLSTFGYFFVLMFLLLPMITHLRFLRTLPISSAALAAALVLLPTASIIALGLFLAVLIVATSGSSADLLTLQRFLIGSGLMAMSVPMFVWRGLAAESFLVLFLIVMGGNLSPMFFKIDKAPLWAIISVSTLLIALAFYLTRRLLRHSSQSYRVRSTALNAWGVSRS